MGTNSCNQLDEAAMTEAPDGDSAEQTEIQETAAQQNNTTDDFGPLSQSFSNISTEVEDTYNDPTQ